MNCYVCHRLKLEQRIERVKPSTMTVNGYSVCDRHAWAASNTDEMLRGIENEREAMRRWFREAVRTRGAFNEKRQKFANGDTLAGTEWPWHYEPETPTPPAHPQPPATAALPGTPATPHPVRPADGRTEPQGENA